MRRKIMYDPARDYYTALGISTTATADELRAAYRQSVRAIHPDRNPERSDWATEQLKLLNEAYGVLRQPALRREYDQLRWPHLPSQGHAADAASTARPFSRPAYTPNRPWWEQAAPQTARERPISTRARRQAAPPTQPYWLTVSAWLKAHGLGRVEPTWLTLVGLWRSPYAGLLTLLTLVLAFNVALIVYVFITPEQKLTVPNPFGSATAVPASPTPAAHDQLYTNCTDAGVQITLPVSGEVIGDSVSVYGTVSHPDLWSYSLAVGYIGRTMTLDSVPGQWTEVRSPPEPQSIPEPAIENDLLTDQPIDLRGQPGGFYVVRLRVVLQYGAALDPCDVVVRR